MIGTVKYIVHEVLAIANHFDRLVSRVRERDHRYSRYDGKFQVVAVAIDVYPS